MKKVNLEEEPLLLGATEGGWGSLGFVSNRLVVILGKLCPLSAPLLPASVPERV